MENKSHKYATRTKKHMVMQKYQQTEGACPSQFVASLSVVVTGGMTGSISPVRTERRSEGWLIA